MCSDLYFECHITSVEVIMRHPILWSLLLVVHTQPARASEPCIAPASECVKQKNSESDTAVRNVNRTPLAMCRQKPLTGWFRDGFCKTDQNDRGRHLVCAQMTDAFLKFTKARGNDLSSPSPRYRFPGLKPGDRWCLCALRWKEPTRPVTHLPSSFAQPTRKHWSMLVLDR